MVVAQNPHFGGAHITSIMRIQIALGNVIG